MSIFEGRAKLIYGFPTAMVGLVWLGLGCLIVATWSTGWLQEIFPAVTFLALVANTPVAPVISFVDTGSESGFRPIPGDPFVVSAVCWLLWHVYVRVALLFWSLREPRRW